MLICGPWWKHGRHFHRRCERACWQWFGRLQLAFRPVESAHFVQIKLYSTSLSTGRTASWTLRTHQVRKRFNLLISGQKIAVGIVFRTITPMDCPFPSDVVTDRDREVYARGWRDRIVHQTRLAGGTKSEKKANAARLNGHKGGKPKGLMTRVEARKAYRKRHPWKPTITITVDRPRRSYDGFDLW